MCLEHTTVLGVNSKRFCFNVTSGAKMRLVLIALYKYLYLLTYLCRGGPVPDRLSATLISRKFVVARACMRGPSRQADVSAAG